jgi:hypothetical protein
VFHLSLSVQQRIAGLMKMAGMMLVAFAIPVGARVALQEVRKHNGIWAIAVCVSIIVGASAVGFVLIWIGNAIAKGYLSSR